MAAKLVLVVKQSAEFTACFNDRLNDMQGCMDGESLPTARIYNIVAKFDDRSPIHYYHSELDNARYHAQIFSVYTDQYRLTDLLNALFYGRLNGKVFSSCDQNNDEVDSTNCGEKDGGW